MSRSQRRSGNPVSLFPFLAVLLCTMGSLSLLLLVTTHRIRHDAVLWAEAQALSQADVEKAVDRVMLVDKTPAPPEQKPDPETQSSPETNKTPASPPPMIDLNSQMERIVSSLTQRRDARRRELQADLAALGSAKKQVQQASEQLSSAESKLAQSRGDQRKHISELQALNERHVTVSGEISEAEKRLHELRQKTANAATRYAFVPYDGASGTIRRPILIECTNKGLRFVPEGILLTAADLESSSLSENPLLAGARSLVDYWSRKSSDSKEPKPYVLLVVRPSGSTAYYAARKLLTHLDQPSGYELLAETDALDVPTPDPQAVAACKHAVEKSIAAQKQPRNKLLAVRGRPGGEKASSARREETGSLRPGTQTPHSGQTVSAKRSATQVGDGKPANWTPESDPTVAAKSQQTTANKPASVGTSPSALAGRPQSPASAGSTFSSESNKTAGAISQTAAAPSNGVALTKPAESRGDAHAQRTAEGAVTSANQFPEFGASSKQGTRESGAESRRWGIAGPRAKIGFHRSLTIYVDAYQLVVGNEQPIAVSDGEPRDRLAAWLMQAIDSEARSWGTPPEHFYWAPAVHFIVSPGGNVHYERLKSQLAGWGLSSTAEYRLDPYKPLRGPE